MLIFSSTCSFNPFHAQVSQVKQRKIAPSFDFMFHDIDDVLSLNNSKESLKIPKG